MFRTVVYLMMALVCKYKLVGRLGCKSFLRHATILQARSPKHAYLLLVELPPPSLPSPQRILRLPLGLRCNQMIISKYSYNIDSMLGVQSQNIKMASGRVIEY